MLQITETGLVIERLDEILERLSNQFKSIYGSDINISPDTPDGQAIGVWSQGVADLNEIIAGVYAMSDPTKAIGTWLDIQLKYVGEQRNKPEYSYLNDVKLNVDIGSIIPTGYTVKDENGTEWQVVNGATATTNPFYLQFRSSEYGAFSLGVAKKLIPKTVILGVKSIETTKISEQGRLKESDEEALMRFLRSYQNNATHDVLGLEGDLLGLPDVRDVIIYENYTATMDAKGVEGHTINTVIIGGIDEDIAKTIIEKKTLGTGLQGSTEVNVFYDEMDRIVNFDRAVKVPVLVGATVVRRSNLIDINVDDIKRKISSNDFSINEEVVAGALYCGINSSDYKIKSITLTAKDVVDGLTIPIGLREYASISFEDVSVDIE